MLPYYLRIEFYTIESGYIISCSISKNKKDTRGRCLFRQDVMFHFPFDDFIRIFAGHNRSHHNHSESDSERHTFYNVKKGGCLLRTKK